MKRKKLSLEEVKNIEVEILDMFDMFCKEHNLRYSLYAGTLIGAIRHKDFIPWDDDIDVCMPRDDYKKLLSIFNLEKRESEFELISGDLDAKYPFPFAKIRKTDTYIERGIDKFVNSGDEHIWIDIFPLDNLPKSEEKAAKMYNDIVQLRKFLVLSMAKPFASTSILRGIIKAPAVFLCKFIGHKRIIKKIIAIATSYGNKNTKYMGHLVWQPKFPGTMFLKDEFNNMIQVDFRGKKYPCMGNYHYYLSGQYGDYMILPPEKDRITHDIDAYLLISNNCSDMK